MSYRPLSDEPRTARLASAHLSLSPTPAIHYLRGARCSSVHGRRALCAVPDGGREEDSPLHLASNLASGVEQIDTCSVSCVLLTMLAI